MFSSSAPGVGGLGVGSLLPAAMATACSAAEKRKGNCRGFGREIGTERPAVNLDLWRKSPGSERRRFGWGMGWRGLLS